MAAPGHHLVPAVPGWVGEGCPRPHGVRCPNVPLPADKKSVESRTDHVVEMGAKCLKISIQPEKGGLSGGQSTSQASASCSQPYHISPPPQGPGAMQAAEGQRDTAAEVVTKKVG